MDLDQNYRGGSGGCRVTFVQFDVLNSKVDIRSTLFFESELVLTTDWDKTILAEVDVGHD